MVAAPVLGGLVIGFMARFGSEKIRGHGIPEAIEAILLGGSRMSAKVAVLKPLSSAIAIGTGGPFGAEGPIIMTGGAIGSLFAQFFHLSAAERKTLLVAGAAAGMTGIFGTPVAAVLLAVELLLFEWRPRSFIPVVAAVVTAISLRPMLFDAGPLFAFSAVPVLPWWGILGCAGVGMATGLLSGLLTKLLYGIEDAFERLPVHWMWWPALGGVVVGLGGLIEPRALGVGYDVIADLLGGHMVLRAVLAILVVKAVIWLVALSSGTSGGVLAPAAWAAERWMESGVSDTPAAAQAVFAASLRLSGQLRLQAVAPPFWGASPALTHGDADGLPQLRQRSSRDLTGAPAWPLAFLRLLTESAQAGMRELIRLNDVAAAGAALTAKMDPRSQVPATVLAVLRAPILTSMALARQLAVAPQTATRLLNTLATISIVREVTGRRSFRAFSA